MRTHRHTFSGIFSDTFLDGLHQHSGASTGGRLAATAGICVSAICACGGDREPLDKLGLTTQALEVSDSEAALLPPCPGVLTKGVPLIQENLSEQFAS
jgi:hypothetical protein